MRGHLLTWRSGCAIALTAAFLSSARADTGNVEVRITKAGFIVGVGGGKGTLTLKGRRYPFRVGGLAFGATIGVSQATLIGRALNIREPSDIEGAYSAVGGGIAAAAGVKSVRLQNGKGVILELAGRNIGFEFSINAAGVNVALQ